MFLCSVFFRSNVFNDSLFPLVHLQAWEDTYAKWDQVTKQILNSPKNKADDGQVSMLHQGSLLSSISSVYRNSFDVCLAPDFSTSSTSACFFVHLCFY